MRWIVAAAELEAVPTALTCDGEKPQEAAIGNPLHAKATVPVKSHLHWTHA